MTVVAGRTAALPVRVLTAAGAGLVVGAGTSFLQSVLPDGIAPLANSGAPWALAGLVVVYLLRATGAGAAGLGALVLVAEVAGYYGTAALRGFGVSAYWTTFWVVAAIVAGAAAGTAAAWLRDPSGARRATAIAVPAGILLGEGASLWWLTGRPEFAAYGIAAMVLGALIAVTGVLRLARSPGHRATGLAVTIVIAAALYGAYAVI